MCLIARIRDQYFLTSPRSSGTWAAISRPISKEAFAAGEGESPSPYIPLPRERDFFPFRNHTIADIYAEYNPQMGQFSNRYR